MKIGELVKIATPNQGDGWQKGKYAIITDIKTNFLEMKDGSKQGYELFIFAKNSTYAWFDETQFEVVDDFFKEYRKK